MRRDATQKRSNGIYYLNPMKNDLLATLLQLHDVISLLPELPLLAKSGKLFSILRSETCSDGSIFWFRVRLILEVFGEISVPVKKRVLIGRK